LPLCPIPKVGRMGLGSAERLLPAANLIMFRGK
jgi:hypothetical protein